MRALIACLCLAALPAACAPSQNTPGAAAGMTPGQYRTTVTFTSGPGAGEAPLTAQQCLTAPVIADLVNDSVDAGGGRTCSENTISTANGRIEGRALCLDDYGFSRTLDVSGTYGASRADIDIAVTTRTESETVHQQGRVAIERIGAC